MSNELTQEAVNISSAAVPQPCASLVGEDLVLAFEVLHLSEESMLDLALSYLGT